MALGQEFRLGARTAPQVKRKQQPAGNAQEAGAEHELGDAVPRSGYVTMICYNVGDNSYYIIYNYYIICIIYIYNYINTWYMCQLAEVVTVVMRRISSPTHPQETSTPWSTVSADISTSMQRCLWWRSASGCSCQRIGEVRGYGINKNGTQLTKWEL